MSLRGGVVLGKGEVRTLKFQLVFNNKYNVTEKSEADHKDMKFCPTGICLFLILPNGDNPAEQNGKETLCSRNGDTIEHTRAPDRLHPSSQDDYSSKVVFSGLSVASVITAYGYVMVRT